MPIANLADLRSATIQNIRWLVFFYVKLGLDVRKWDFIVRKLKENQKENVFPVLVASSTERLCGKE